MAYTQTPNGTLLPAVAGADVLAGKLVTLANNTNGMLPRAVPAASTATVVYVALPEDDGYNRPTDERFYLAGEHGIGDVFASTGWLFETEQITYHKIGLASQYEATIKEGMRMIAAKGVVVAVTPNCYVDSAGIKQEGALVKVASGAGNEGKFELAGASDTPVGVVVGVFSDNRLSIHVF